MPSGLKRVTNVFVACDPPKADVARKKQRARRAGTLQLRSTYKFELEEAMDWKILFSTFLTIFLAELGDKTQLGVIFLSSQTQKPVSVFIGAVVALAVVTFFGVALGALITKAVPINVIKDIAGGAFILLGILILLGRF